MGLTLITGRANTGKTGVLYASLRDAAKHSQPVLVLPQAPDVRRAVNEFAEKSVFGIRPVVFDEWLAELWHLHGDGRRLVGDAARGITVTRAAREAGLSALGESAKAAGFPSMFAELVAELVVPIRAAQRGVTRELADFIEVYRRLLLNEGLIEAVDAAALLAAEPPQLGGMVGVNRFGDLSASQEMVLLAMSRVTNVEIALTWQGGSAATAALTPLVTRLLDAGARHVVADEPSWTDVGLAALEQALFEQKPVLDAPGAVSIGLASGDEAECALAARVVRHALDAGTDPAAVALVFRNAGARASMLASALSAEGVAAAIDISVPFGRTPLGAAILSLLDACAGRGDTRERLGAYLLTPYSGVHTEEVARLDREWRKQRTPSERIIWSAAAEAGPEPADTLRRAQGLARDGVSVATVRNWKLLADRLLAAAHRRRGLSGFTGELDAAAHRAFSRVIADIAGTGTPVGEVDLSRALRVARVSTGAGEEEGRVLVTEAHRLRGRRFDVVVLGGLTADEFSSERREPLVRRLAERLGQPTGMDPRLAERMLFHTMVTRARKRLVLLRQATDARGEAIRPSVFFEDVLDVYRTPEQAAEGEIPACITVDRLSVADLAAAAPALLPGRRALRANAQEYAATPPARGRLTNKSVLSELAQRDEFSVSEIEAYLGCPYRWFLQRALRPEEIDAAFDARARGSFAHQLLSVFYIRWHEAGRGRIRPEDLDDALEMLAMVAEAAERTSGPLAVRALGDRLSQAKALTWARAILADDVTFLPGFAPELHELRFGTRHDKPIEFAGVKLTGSIDRVDVGPQGVVVVDYKSSSSVHGWTTFTDKGLVQIPVYGAVASALLGRPMLGGIYRSLSSLKCRGFWDAEAADPGAHGKASDGVDAASAQAIVAEARVAVSAAVEGMRAGHIAPDPRSAASCAHCDARAVCGHGGRTSSC